MAENNSPRITKYLMRIGKLRDDFEKFLLRYKKETSCDNEEKLEVVKREVKIKHDEWSLVDSISDTYTIVNKGIGNITDIHIYTEEFRNNLEIFDGEGRKLRFLSKHSDAEREKDKNDHDVAISYCLHIFLLFPFTADRNETITLKYTRIKWNRGGKSRLMCKRDGSSSAKKNICQRLLDILGDIIPFYTNHDDLFWLFNLSRTFKSPETKEGGYNEGGFTFSIELNPETEVDYKLISYIDLSLPLHITTCFQGVGILWDKLKLWHSRIVVLLLQWRARIYGKKLVKRVVLEFCSLIHRRSQDIEPDTKNKNILKNCLPDECSHYFTEGQTVFFSLSTKDIYGPKQKVPQAQPENRSLFVYMKTKPTWVDNITLSSIQILSYLLFIVTAVSVHSKPFIYFIPLITALFIAILTLALFPRKSRLLDMRPTVFLFSIGLSIVLFLYFASTYYGLRIVSYLYPKLGGLAVVTIFAGVLLLIVIMGVVLYFINQRLICKYLNKLEKESKICERQEESTEDQA